MKYDVVFKKPKFYRCPTCGIKLADYGEQINYINKTIEKYWICPKCLYQRTVRKEWNLEK